MKFKPRIRIRVQHQNRQTGERQIAFMLYDGGHMGVFFRSDRKVVRLRPRQRQRRFGLLQITLGTFVFERYLAPLIIADETVFIERRILLKIFCGVFGGHAGGGDFAEGGGLRRFNVAAIKFHQNVALFDGVPFLEVYRTHISREATRNCHTGIGNDAAGRRKHGIRLTAGDGGDRYRSRHFQRGTGGVTTTGKH